MESPYQEHNLKSSVDKILIEHIINFFHENVHKLKKEESEDENLKQNFSDAKSNVFVIPKQNRTKEDEIYGRRHFVIFFAEENSPEQIHFHSDSICAHSEISKTVYELNFAIRLKDSDSDTKYGFMLVETYNAIQQSKFKNQFIPMI
jgi:hypothetical protein